MPAAVHSPLAACLMLLVAWMVIAFAGLLRPQSVAYAGRALFLVGAAVGAALAVVAATSIALPPEQLVLPFGLPDLPFHLRRDALASVFLALLGAVTVIRTMFSASS